MERFLKDLFETTFEELEDKGFDLIRVVEMLCEVCERPLSKKEKFLRRIQITSREDYQNLLDRASVHDRAEVDVDKSKIYFFDHDFPGDVHSECIDKL
jgi:GTP cyclohydrolase FolE2